MTSHTPAPARLRVLTERQDEALIPFTFDAADDSPLAVACAPLAGPRTEAWLAGAIGESAETRGAAWAHGARGSDRGGRAGSNHCRRQSKQCANSIAECHGGWDYHSRYAGPATAHWQYCCRAAGPVPTHRRHIVWAGDRRRQQRRVVLDVGAPKPAARGLYLPARSVRQQQHSTDYAG